MRQSLALVAVLANLILLTAFSAQAAEGVSFIGHGMTKLLDPMSSSPNGTKLQLQQSKLLITSTAIKHSEIEEPLSQGKRKDTTSAGINRSSAEPKRNSSEKPAQARSERLLEWEKPSDSKFGIYHAIKESVLDLFLPSRKKQVEKVDMSRVHKDGRTESAKQPSKPQPVR